MLQKTEEENTKGKTLIHYASIPSSSPILQLSKISSKKDIFMCLSGIVGQLLKDLTNENDVQPKWVKHFSYHATISYSILLIFNWTDSSDQQFFFLF